MEIIRNFIDANRNENAALSALIHPSAEAMSLICKIDGHIVYICPEEIVAEYEAVK
jgi:hypothetical protein